MQDEKKQGRRAPRAASPSVGGPAGTADGSGRARALARHVGEQAKDLGREKLEEGKHLLAGQAEEQKERARGELESIAGALHAAGEAMDGEGSQLAHYASDAAIQVERFAGYLGQRDLQTLVRDARAIARRRPEAFLGALYLGGVAIGRLLKASTPPELAGELGATRREPDQTK